MHRPKGWHMVHPNSLETEVPTLDHFQILYYAPLPLLFICTLNRILHNKLASVMEKGKNAPPPGCSEPAGILRRRPSLALLVQTRKGIHCTVMPRGRLCIKLSTEPRTAVRGLGNTGSMAHRGNERIHAEAPSRRLWRLVLKL